jgi:hypothetical protein
MKPIMRLILKSFRKFTFFVFVFISCSNTDDNNNANSELVCGEEILNYSGTICCVTGSELANPGENLTYQYNSNIISSVFTWEIVSGSITIISGQNTSVVTLEFGNDFTTGVVLGRAVGDEICTESITINKR